jgi:hypothetical protein
MPIFHKTVCAHIKYKNLHVNISLNYFKILNLFLSKGLPESKVHFRLYFTNLLHLICKVVNSINLKSIMFYQLFIILDKISYFFLKKGLHGAQAPFGFPVGIGLFECPARERTQTISSSICWEQLCKSRNQWVYHSCDQNEHKAITLTPQWKRLGQMPHRKHVVPGETLRITR